MSELHQPVSIAVYRRLVRASLERIWENVLDWEHLPWLHRSSFHDIELLAHDQSGWRATVTLAAEQGGGDAQIEVRLERDRLRYTTTTLAGVGAGTEIVTALEPLGQDQTRISVDFRAALPDPDEARAVGELYKTLYARLWDEDEAMMIARERVLAWRRRDRDAGDACAARTEAVALGPRDRVRACVPLLVETEGQPLRVVEVDGELAAHASVCPHRGGPLADAAVEDGCVRCPWHGYLFDVRSGRSADGRNLRLEPAARVQVDEKSDEAWLSWADEPRNDRSAQPAGGSEGGLDE